MSYPPPTKGKIIVFGILFWYPLAGVTYQFLHYLIGLRKLGYDPYYIEDSGRWIYDPRLNDFSPDVTGNLELVVPVLKQHGFGDRWAFRGNYPDGKCYGMTEEQILQLYRDAEAFLNVTGAQEIRDEHRQVRRRIYVESDPFASQVKRMMLPYSWMTVGRMTRVEPTASTVSRPTERYGTSRFAISKALSFWVLSTRE